MTMVQMTGSLIDLKNDQALIFCPKDDDSDMEDDDSIGPLPVLRRSKSMRPSHRHKTIGPPHRPSKSTSSQTNTKAPCSSLRIEPKFTERRPSRQPVAAGKPDPPEQIKISPSPPRPLASKKVHPIKLDEDFPERPLRRAKSLEVPKQPKRTTSLPMFGRGKSQATKGKVQRQSSKKPYVGRQSKAIARVFPESKMDINNDVWVQRMVVREGKKPQVFFKSVFTRECRLEPPTGALNIVYMDELVKVHQPENKPQQTAVVAKTKSMWGRSSSATPAKSPRPSPFSWIAPKTRKAPAAPDRPPSTIRVQSKPLSNTTSLARNPSRK